MDDKDFIVYANQVVSEAHKQGAMIRLLGAVAFHIHCPAYGFFQEKAQRHFTDLDFAAYFNQNDAIRKTFAKLGYEEDREVAVVYARQRLVFDQRQTSMHVDIFFDKLDFCHPIYWAKRLEMDSPTIPLAEMLLEKMQIIQLNEKDVIDTLMLLREHPLDSGDHEAINARLISELCSKDWGLWRTVTMNLRKVSELSANYAWLEDPDRKVIQGRIQDLLGAVDAQPKSTAWKMRDAVGDRVKWYKEVHEISQ